jgi:hypothetical protein
MGSKHVLVTWWYWQRRMTAMGGGCVKTQNYSNCEPHPGRPLPRLNLFQNNREKHNLGVRTAANEVTCRRAKWAMTVTFRDEIADVISSRVNATPRVV